MRTLEIVLNFAEVILLTILTILAFLQVRENRRKDDE